MWIIIVIEKIEFSVIVILLINKLFYFIMLCIWYVCNYNLLLWYKLLEVWFIVDEVKEL